jgi:uncharacterized membrane protein
MNQFEIATSDGQSVRVARLMPDAHWQWLANGWLDFKATWRYGVLIGAVPVVAAWLMVAILWRAGMLAFVPAVCGGFALVGPLLAIGCYEVSRKRALGEAITLQAILKPRIVSPGQVALIGFVLMLILFVWARLATLLYALASSARQPAASIDFLTFTLQTPQGIAMVVIGTLVGGVLAAIGYLVSVVSIPLAADQDVDALTAMLVSVVAVARNKGAMLSFAFNIAILIAISLATGFIALIFIFPWLGHATWHCFHAVVQQVPEIETNGEKSR